MDQKGAMVPLVLEKLTGAKKAAVRKTAGKAGISVEQYLQKVSSGLKWCPNCKSSLSLELFQNHKRRDGEKYSYCKNCANSKSRECYQRRLSSPNKMLERKIVLPRDGDKKQARYRVNKEVEKGKIPHAQTVACIDCGHVGTDRRHHYDHYLGYAGINHLVVECVCITCHQERERQRGKQPYGHLITVRQAIEMLQKCNNPDAKVRIHFKGADNYNKNP